MKKILFIGPLPPPITGQSVAFSYLKEFKNRNENFSIFDTQKYRIQALNYLSTITVLPLVITFSIHHTVYFIGSRSKLGFLRQLPFLALAIFKKIRLINHLHGADFKSFYKNSGILKPMIRWVYSNVDTSIILLEQMRDQFEDFPKLKLKVVPNVVGKEFENLNLKFPKKEAILYLSNIMASKGIVEFLKASKLLLETRKNIEINIAGGFIGDHLKSKKEVQSIFYRFYEPLKARYPKQINFHGTVHGENKLALLISSSLFVLPTYYPTEAFPISILEAMATGNTIITTSHNYLENVITSENGVLIPIKNENEIVVNVNRLFKNKKILAKTQKNNLNQAKLYHIENYLNSIKRIIEND